MVVQLFLSFIVLCKNVIPISMYVSMGKWFTNVLSVLFQFSIINTSKTGHPTVKTKYLGASCTINNIDMDNPVSKSRTFVFNFRDNPGWLSCKWLLLEMCLNDYEGNIPRTQSGSCQFINHQTVCGFAVFCTFTAYLWMVRVPCLWILLQKCKNSSVQNSSHGISKCITSQPMSQLKFAVQMFLKN